MFSQTLQSTTAGGDSSDMELQPQPDPSAVGRSERTNWLLSSPEPPPFWRHVFTSIKGTVLPQQDKKRPNLPNRVFVFLKGIFPILEWARHYKPITFKNDLLAGLTLASLCIPQSIGYANLAKLDPQYGLYTSVVPPLIYAVMGSSREIAIGPVAVVSLLLSAMISKEVDPAADPVAYRQTVFTVTFFAGAFQLLFGIFRLGFLVDFLSHAAIVGFMGGAAIVIGLQQLKGLFGIAHFTTKTDIVSVLSSVAKSLQHQWSPLNTVLGCSFLIFILVSRFIGRRKKKLFWLSAIAPLLAVILATLISYLSKADKHGVNIVKHFKGGINPSSASQLNFSGPNVGASAKMGLICALIALTEAIAVGRSFASIKGYQLDGNKEMTAMGVMNLVGSLTSCYTATGSFSRTAVNYSAGCETVVSNVVMSMTVLTCLLFFTKLLYYTPMAILASIILSALPGLIDFREAYNIWKVDKLDFLVCLSAFFGVLFGSVEIGLVVAVVISFGSIIVTSLKPRTEVLGRLPGTADLFCNVLQYPTATKVPGVLILRLSSATLCFANATFIRERILRYVEDEKDAEENGKAGIHALILDLINVINMDTSGIRALEELYHKLSLHGIQLAIVNPKWEVITKMKAVKLVEKIGAEWVFLSIGDAVNAASSSSYLKIHGHGPNTC